MQLSMVLKAVRKLLGVPHLASAFAQTSTESLPLSDGRICHFNADIDAQAQQIHDAFDTVARQICQEPSSQPNRPWMRQATLTLIDSKRVARLAATL